MEEAYDSRSEPKSLKTTCLLPRLSSETQEKAKAAQMALLQRRTAGCGSRTGFAPEAQADVAQRASRKVGGYKASPASWQWWDFFPFVSHFAL